MTAPQRIRGVLRVFSMARPEGQAGQAHGVFRHFPCKWKCASGKEKITRGAGAAESRLWEEGPARRAGDLLGVPNFSDGRRVGFGGKVLVADSSA